MSNDGIKIDKLFAQVAAKFRPKHKKDPKKNASEFVKNQQSLNARIVYSTLWESQHQGTYIRKKHGALK